MVLNFAIKREYISNNPFTHVDLPTNASKKNNVVEKEEVENFYTREQLIEYLSCLEKESNFKVYALFRLLAFSGMRKGEAFALTWNDLNFTTNELCINKALSSGKNNRLYLKTTKTGEARTIKMDDKTMQQKQLVFSNEHSKHMQLTKTRKWIVYVQNKYKLGKITTHGLRHTHCSLLFEACASLKQVQDRLGHSDVKTTMNIYAHVTKKA